MQLTSNASKIPDKFLTIFDTAFILFLRTKKYQKITLVLKYRPRSINWLKVTAFVVRKKKGDIYRYWKNVIIKFVTLISDNVIK